MAIFNSYVTNYQRVISGLTLPKLCGILINHDKPMISPFVWETKHNQYNEMGIMAHLKPSQPGSQKELCFVEYVE
jgi:hypothetical protein